MPIRIVTDSTCDLPETLTTEYGITVVPLYINLGRHSYLDGLELSRQTFYEQLAAYNPPPTTASPGAGLFSRVYQTLVEEGAAEILSIHVAGALSATANNARLGAAEVKSVGVTIFDSRQASLGTGFLVLTAARAVAEGCPMTEILARLDSQVKRTYLFAALDTLEFLKRSGRINWATAGFGSLLQIKPLVKLHNGQATVERVRTRRRATERLVDLLSDIAPVEQLALLHSNAPEEAKALRRRIQHLLPEGEVLCVEVTPILGTHVGPGAVGLVCLAAA